MPDGRESANGINILILEGGGARGLSSLIIVKEVMNRLQHSLGLMSMPKVCEYFDVVAGTGTGAFIACMLGRLEMTVDQAIENYVKLVDVFLDRKLFGTTVYKTTKLQSVLKGIVRDTTGSENTYMMGSVEERKCKTMVFAMSHHNLNAGLPRIFRSYHVVANQMADCTIWEAISASLAHPEMFKAIDIANVLAVTKHLATDAERVAQEMTKRFKSTKNVYFRLSVDQGMEDVGLSEWEKLSDVTAHARVYMQVISVREMVDQVALVIGERKATIYIRQIDGEIQTCPPTVQKKTGLKICPAPTPVFTGRQAQIDQIVSCISCGDKQRCVFVLYGLGGTGKTQLALKTVEQTKHMWSDLVFVDATSHETATSNLAEFAKEKNSGDSYEDALRWLSCQRSRWLMVIDNADDPFMDIKKYFPVGNTGSILVTTRIPQIAMLTQGPSPDHEVSGMNSSEAMCLLLKLVKMRDEDLPEAERQAAIQLFESFGYLALAIVQAGAYIFCSRRTIAEYRDMYFDHRQLTLEKYNELFVRIDDYQKSVYTTWHMSYQLLSSKAQQILHLIAFMHHDGIIEDIFRRAAINLKKYKPIIPATEAEVKIQAYLTECLKPYLDPADSWSSSTFLSTMTELMSYSLVTYNKAGGTYALHVLVHDWARTVVNHSIEVAVEHTALLLAVSIKHTTAAKDMAYIRKLEVHINRALEQQPQPNANNASKFGDAYNCLGKWNQQEKMVQISVDGRQRELGDMHLQTMTSIMELAMVYQHQGKYEQAVALLVPTLDSAKLVFGQEGDTTISVMSYLAGVYDRMYRCDEAKSLLLQVVNVRKIRLGDKNPQTLVAMSILAFVHYHQSNYKQAELLQVEVLEARRGGHHDDPSNLLKSMNDLAITYLAQQRFAEAQELQLEVVSESTKLCGPDHPDTLSKIFNLAATYYNQGQCEKAEVLFVQVVEGRKRMLGVSHPRTLRSMAALLRTYRNMGVKRQQKFEALCAEINCLKPPAQ
ncbi:kinesin light chain [Ceratobasidium sp. AG-Ba]|nr:kinesin light chain [Ceratobasidium sp. AG-Ba]